MIVHDAGRSFSYGCWLRFFRNLHPAESLFNESFLNNEYFPRTWNTELFCIKYFHSTNFQLPNFLFFHGKQRGKGKEKKRCQDALQSFWPYITTYGNYGTYYICRFIKFVVLFFSSLLSFKILSNFVEILC